MPLTQVQGGMILPSTTLTTPIVATTMGVGGATPAASGSGITFPATQSASSDANTLDDYEEGTFTPVMAGSGTVGGYSNQLGRYTKIGNTVIYELQLTITTVGSLSGQILIGGLPFVPSSSVVTNYSIFVGRSLSFNTAPVTGVIVAAQNVIEPYKFTTGNNTTDLVASDLATGSNFFISGFYQI